MQPGEVGTHLLTPKCGVQWGNGSSGHMVVGGETQAVRDREGTLPPPPTSLIPLIHHGLLPTATHLLPTATHSHAR